MCSLSIAEDFQKSFLHGELTIQILKAEELSDIDENTHNQGNASCIFLKRAFKFSQKLENPFVGVYLGNNCICQTSCHSNDSNPVWNERFSVPVCNNANSLNVIIKDQLDNTTSRNVASTEFPTHKIIRQRDISGWFQLKRHRNDSQDIENCRDIDSNGGWISLQISYKPKHELPYPCGNESHLEDAYFPPRYNNASLVLYQTAANCPGEKLAAPGTLDPIDDRPCSSLHQCDDNEGVYGDWKKDLYESIQNATKFIYLAIPSFNPNVVLLLNETKNKKSATVGEMLHEKYQKGIYNTCTKVIVLVTKHDKMKAPSMTPSKYTSDYFDGLNIPCIVKSDRLRRKYSELKPFHGQRYFVMDEPADDGNKQDDNIVAYIGIELESIKNETMCDCRGYNCGISKFKGLPAEDIKTNFEDRLQKLEGDPKFLMSSILFASREWKLPNRENKNQSPHGWTIQILRSVSSKSFKFSDGERSRILKVSKCGKQIDDSIYRNLIWQIRNAKRFIFLECPKFVGSSSSWDIKSVEETETILNDSIENIITKDNNIIPQEIAEKIVDNILLKKDHFKVYVVLQDIESINKSQTRSYRHRFLMTVEMMYRKIARALRETDSEGHHPTDYLVFFRSPDCIKSIDKNVRTNIAIFDDEYAMVGCLNGGIDNEHLSGSEYEEIGIGAFQPNYSAKRQLVFDRDHVHGWKSVSANLQLPKGDVYKYRMSRWCTLFGEYPCPSEFKNPGSNVCMEKVQSICSNGSTSGYSTRSSSTSNWSNGSFEELDLSKPSNTCWNKGDTYTSPYPIEISEDGSCQWAS